MPATILLVEDTPDNLKLMTYLLRAYGHTVLAVESGEEALAAATTHRPDVVIMDIQLPGIDGYQALQRLRADPERPAIPVIAVTANAMVGNRDQALAAGFDGYITKPINPTDFVPAIEAHLTAALRGSQPARKKPTTTAPKSEKLPQRGRILAVDDRRANLTLLRSVLQPRGYTVTCAADSEQALALARADRPDLILCDIHLGNKSGTEALRQLRAVPELADVPFAFLSATSVPSSGPVLDGVPVIYKPIEPELLLSHVAALLTPASTG